jgi:hypothetical protein
MNNLEILKRIENRTLTDLLKLKVKYEIEDKMKLPLSVISIIIMIFLIILIILPDFCRIASCFKGQNRNNRITNISENNKEETKEDECKRSFIRNIDRRVLNFEFKKNQSN